MTELNYKITFFSDWHCGSGLAAGADVDALVVKDKDNLPFVPGKTVKGLVREQVELLAQIGNGNKMTDDKIHEAFGFFDNKDKKQTGTMYFSNAELCENEKNAIISNKVQGFLYRGIASTKIDENGIAFDKSLRRMEVTVPCVLFGKITGIPDGFEENIINGMKMIKRLGQNRNRGLGRCQFSTIEKGGDK